MKKFVKLLLVLILIAVVISISIIERIKNSPDYQAISEQLLEETASLNARYNLVGVATLGSADTPLLGTVFNNKVFEASLIDNGQQRKNLIVKLDGQKENDNLENLLVLTVQTDVDIQEIAKKYDELETIKYAESDYEIELDFSPEVEEDPEVAEEQEIIETEEIVDTQEIAEDQGIAETQEASEINLESDKKDIEVSPLIIGVVDSGADTSHADLKGHFVEGWDFIDEDSEVNDQVGHGTHVAGIIIKNSPNSLIMPIKFTDGKTGRISNVIESIKYATDHEVDILNLSIGLPENSRALREAIKYAQEKNILVIAASGNKNSDEEYYPAAWSKVIAVSAVNGRGEKTKNSNYGDWVDFSALGQSVYSTEPGNHYKYRTGTSQAAPLVTARAAETFYELMKEGKLEKEKVFAEVYGKLEEISQQVAGDFAGQLGRLIR